MDLRAMECDFSGTKRRPCANEGLLVGCRCPSRKSLENFGVLPRTGSPTAVLACSDEVEEIGDDLSKNFGEKKCACSLLSQDWRSALPCQSSPKSKTEDRNFSCRRRRETRRPS